MIVALNLVPLMIAAAFVRYSYREIAIECYPHGEPFDMRSFALDLALIFAGAIFVLLVINLAAWWLR